MVLVTQVGKDLGRVCMASEAAPAVDMEEPVGPGLIPR